MSASQVVLWRHGRTEHNLQQRFQGQLDTPLDDVGRQQAADAASYLAKLQPARIVSSDLVRAFDTAQALGDLTGLPVETDRELREIYAGSWEGLTRPEIRANWPENYEAWRRGDDVPVGGGESRAQLAARVTAAIERHVATTEGVLVIASHGAALRGATLTLMGLPVSNWGIFVGLANTHWSTLVPGGRGGWQLLQYNVGPPGAFSGPEG